MNRNQFSLQELAQVLVNAQPNPQNRPFTHIVETAKCIVDTHLGNVAQNRRVTLRDPVPNIRVVSIGSFVVPNVLLTIKTGFNDRFYTHHRNTNVMTGPNFTLQHTLLQQNYTADTLAAAVAATIQNDLRLYDATFTGWTVTGINVPSSADEGKLKLTIGATLASPFRAGQTFELSVNNDSQSQFEYFGLPDEGRQAPIDLPPASSSVDWTSQFMMDMSRTAFITVLSDLGSKTRIGPGMVRKTLLHVPFINIQFGFCAAESFSPENNAHKLPDVQTIQSFEFDILDDRGRSIISEFAQIGAVFELVFYQ